MDSFLLRCEYIVLGDHRGTCPAALWVYREAKSRLSLDLLQQTVPEGNVCVSVISPIPLRHLKIFFITASEPHDFSGKVGREDEDEEEEEEVLRQRWGVPVLNDCFCNRSVRCNQAYHYQVTGVSGEAVLDSLFNFSPRFRV
ncbi:uncharacterized [Tachysurus ichikawai]